MHALPFQIYLITDRRLAPGEDLPALLARALDRVPPDLVAVQLREKDLGAKDLSQLAEAVLRVTRDRGVLLLVNDRVDVALATGADGVHLAGHSLAPVKARALLGPRRVLGASAHSLAEARAARQGGCDFATFGPVFETPSKARYGPPLGLAALSEAAAALAPFPLVALGGVAAKNAADCRRAGAHAVAAIRAILAAPDPAAAIRALQSAR